MRDAATSWLLDRARDDLAAGERAASRRGIEEAARINPRHPDPPAMLAEDRFSEIASGPMPRREGERWARIATSLRPDRAYGHYLLSLYRLAAGDLGEAWVELTYARELFPSRELYQIQERRLREMAAAIPAPSEAGDGS
jgi:hypothetical protein